MYTESDFTSFGASDVESVGKAIRSEVFLGRAVLYLKLGSR